jgi:hypothetical protein
VRARCQRRLDPAGYCKWKPTDTEAEDDSRYWKEHFHVCPPGRGILPRVIASFISISSVLIDQGQDCASAPRRFAVKDVIDGWKM